MKILRAVAALAWLLALPAGAADEPKLPLPFETYRGQPPERVVGSSRVVEARSRFVLGPVLQGDEVHHSFQIPNPGPEPMELRDVSVCSGCIPAGHSQRIAPGGVGQISILITTDWLGGRGIDGAITATTTSPALPQLEIQVVLEVKEFAALDPYRVWLRGTAGAAEPITATCLVVPNEDYPFSITGIETRRGVWFEHSLREVERDGRRAYEITLVNTRTKPGPYQDVLFVQTDHPERPEFRIRVEGRLEPSSENRAGR